MLWFRRHITTELACEYWKADCSPQISYDLFMSQVTRVHLRHLLVAADGASLDARLAALLAVKYHAKAYDCRQERMTAASCWGMCLGCICVGLHDAWARKVSGNPGQRSNLAYELLPCWLPAA